MNDNTRLPSRDSLKGRNFLCPWDAPPATMTCAREYLVSFHLSVVGIVAVFPEEMLIVEPAREGRCVMADGPGEIGGASQGFENHGIMRGCSGVTSPSERPMIDDQHARDG